MSDLVPCGLTRALMLVSTSKPWKLRSQTEKAGLTCGLKNYAGLKFEQLYIYRFVFVSVCDSLEILLEAPFWRTAQRQVLPSQHVCMGKQHKHKHKHEHKHKHKHKYKYALIATLGLPVALPRANPCINSRRLPCLLILQKNVGDLFY